RDRMKKLLYIYNPMSGQKTIGNHLSEIVEYFSKKSYFPTVYATQKANDAREKVKEFSKEYEEILVSGGDGTLDEVVSGLLKSEEKSIIGYIPTGSTNDFSRSLKIPTDIKKATKLAINGETMDIDVGKFNSKFFTYVAAFGSIAQVSYETDQSMKNIFGRFAYILEGVKTVSNLKAYKAKITIDDEVLIKKPKGLIELNQIIDGLRSKKENDNVIFRSGSVFKVESDEKISWTLDGDYGGSYKKSEVKVLNRAVKMRCGFSKDSKELIANKKMIDKKS
ncbi:MAG: diacylglycerol kinase family lipid kinase, partial [Anaerococcus hydrogenalis]|nr:diacylglycerol kinase family lipid kinase [Anaerococcus hydrogenalis]